METKSPVSVDFSHRLIGSLGDDRPSLIDSVGMMTERATGILHLLSCLFEGSDNRPSDAIIVMSIDAAIQEIEDIKATVRAHAYAETANNKA